MCLENTWKCHDGTIIAISRDGFLAGEMSEKLKLLGTSLDFMKKMWLDPTEKMWIWAGKSGKLPMEILKIMIDDLLKIAPQNRRNM